FLVSCMVFARVWNGETWTGELFRWIAAGPFQVAVDARVDQLSAVMLLVVTGVGFLIHLYSIGYMHGDDGYARFFTYLNLFVFSRSMMLFFANSALLCVLWEVLARIWHRCLRGRSHGPAADFTGEKARVGK